MKCYASYREIDEIAEGLIRQFNTQFHTNSEYVDIERFVTGFLGYQIRYENMAEADRIKMAFLADGKTPLHILENGKRITVIFPEKTIVLDRFYQRSEEECKKRFAIAHEAGHIIMNKLCGMPVVAAFQTEFDKEREYSIQELKEMLSLGERYANNMASALLMPRTKVTEVMKRVTSKERLPIYGDSVIDIEDKKIIEQMASVLKVSFSAMFLCLKQLELTFYRPIEEYITKHLGDVLKGGMPDGANF